MKNKVKMIRQNNKFINNSIVIIFSLFMINCIYKKEKDLREFNPEMTTKLDLNRTHSLILEKYHNNKRISSERINFEYKFKVDTSFSKFKLAKYRFKLSKKLDLSYDYKIAININDKNYLYYFQNFDYDTVHSNKSMGLAIDSYILNGKKRYYRDTKFYLDPDDEDISSQR
ncbi:hypothetical protein [Flavobacterium hydrophilum]|nr:hypothetical protein [Flavobacterium hydrophilum]